MFELPIHRVKEQWVPRLRSALPTVSPLPGLIGRAMLKRDHYQPGAPLPALVERLEECRIDRDHLLRYRKLCGYSRQLKLPPSYLALPSFAPMLRLMLSPQMPLPMMGQVHLRNRIAVCSAFDLAAPLTVEVQLGEAVLTAAGLEWQLISTVYAEGEQVWQAVSTSLHRCRTGLPRSRSVSKVKFSGFKERQALQLSAELGRRYARVSGDFNPIHLADVTAGMFGFKQAIIHGMWSKARALAALEEQLPAAGYSAEVQFMRPIGLPAEVLLGLDREARGEQLAAFAIAARDGRSLHLHGHCERLPS